MRDTHLLLPSRPRVAAAMALPLTLGDVGPASTVAALDEQELSVLRQVGVRWGQALGDQRA